jgi:hypothetical protein
MSTEEEGLQAFSPNLFPKPFFSNLFISFSGRVCFCYHSFSSLVVGKSWTLSVSQRLLKENILKHKTKLEEQNYDALFSKLSSLCRLGLLFFISFRELIRD